MPKLSQDLGILHAEQDPKVKEILVECYRDTALYCKTFYPEIFSLEFSSAHRDIFDVIDNSDARKIAIKAPRGVGKTSIIKAYGSKAAHYQIAHFIPYIGQTSSFAEVQTENIKSMMTNTKLGVELFGAPEERLSKGIPEIFAKTAWMFNNGVFFLPRGAGQQVRGINIQIGPDNYRPELILVDDLQSVKLLQNELLRLEQLAWFYGDVMKTKAYGAKYWKIIYIETLKHADSLLQQLLDDPDWESIEISLADENLKSLLPTFISDKEVQDMYDEHDRLGILDVFYREMLGMPVATKDRSFSKEMFKDYSEEDKEFKEEIAPRLINIGLLDPARSVKVQSAKSGFVIWGLDPLTKNLYLRIASGLKMYPDDLYQHTVGMNIFFKTVVFGYETAGLEEHIIYPLELKAKELRYSGQLVKLKARRGSGEYTREDGKLARIASLVPFYRQGRIYHNVANKHAIESQLLTFPNSRYKDIMDAAAYITQILKEGDLFPLGITEDTTDYQSEDEKFTKLLENSEPPLEEWIRC